VLEYMVMNEMSAATMDVQKMRILKSSKSRLGLSAFLSRIAMAIRLIRKIEPVTRIVGENQPKSLRL